jgi:hypothetical protein
MNEEKMNVCVTDRLAHSAPDCGAATLIEDTKVRSNGDGQSSHPPEAECGAGSRNIVNPVS